MMNDAPGPLTRCSGGTSAISPTSSRSLLLVSASTANSASQSAGSATRSKSWIGGKRLGISRWQGVQLTSATGGTHDGGAAEVTPRSPALRVEVLAHPVEVGDVAG